MYSCLRLRSSEPLKPTRVTTLIEHDPESLPESHDYQNALTTVSNMLDKDFNRLYYDRVLDGLMELLAFLQEETDVEERCRSVVTSGLVEKGVALYRFLRQQATVKNQSLFPTGLPLPRSEMDVFVGYLHSLAIRRDNLEEFYADEFREGCLHLLGDFFWNMTHFSKDFGRRLAATGILRDLANHVAAHSSLALVRKVLTTKIVWLMAYFCACVCLPAFPSVFRPA